MLENTVIAIKVKRCAEGEQLHQAWMEALQTEDRALTVARMQAYFVHKNGVFNRMGKRIAAGCRECRFEREEG